MEITVFTRLFVCNILGGCYNQQSFKRFGQTIKVVFEDSLLNTEAIGKYCLQINALKRKAGVGSQQQVIPSNTPFCFLLTE